MSLEVRGFGEGGRYVVLLHGAPTRPGHLESIAHALAAEHRVLCVSSPGYGTSEAIAPPFEVTDIERRIEDALLDHGAAEAVLVGFSAGGYHALSIALRGRVRARAVFVLGGFANLPDQGREGLRGFADAIRDGVDLAEVFVERMLGAGPHDEARRAEVASWLRATSAVNLAAELDAFARSPDLLPHLARLDCRVVARAGEYDAAAPVALSEEIARTAHRGELQVRGVGHALLLMDHEQTVAAIRAVATDC